MKLSDFKKNDNTIVWILLFVILAIGACLRFYHIGHLSFWNDEIASVLYAQTYYRYLFNLDPNMSLFYTIVHYWVLIFPHSSSVVFRSITATFSIISILVMFYLGKSFESKQPKRVSVGLASAFLIAINVFQIQYAQEFRAYSLVFLLTSLSTFFLIKSVEHTEPKNKWDVLYIITSAASVYTHFFALLIILAHIITIPILLFGKTGIFKISRFLRNYIFITILICPLVIIGAHAGTSIVSWISPLTYDIFINFLKTITGNKDSLLPTIYAALVIIGITSSVLSLWNKNLIEKWKFFLILSCSFIPLIVTILFSLMVQPIFIDKYLIIITPYLAILTATGMVNFVASYRDWKIGMIPISFALSVNILFLSAKGIDNYYTYSQKEDWKGASQFLTINCSSSLRLYYEPFLQQNIVYYNSKLQSQVNWQQYLYDYRDINDITNILPNDYSEMCLLLTHVSDVSTGQMKVINTVLKTQYPHLDSEFHTHDIEIYKRSK